MKRSAIKRKTPLNRGSYLNRGKGLSPRRKRPRTARDENGERVSRRDLEFGPQAALCRILPCCVCKPLRSAGAWQTRAADCLGFLLLPKAAQEQLRQCDPHHEEHTRGSGRGRDEHCVPLCRLHHDERGASTRGDFEARHDVNLKVVAKGIRMAVDGLTGARRINETMRGEG